MQKGGNPALVPVDCGSTMKSGYLSPAVLPFIFHLGFMAATAFFVMHVQVRVLHILFLFIIVYRC